MSRNIPVALQTVLNGEVMGLAVCATLTRVDGVVYGFTNHDYDVTFNGIVYSASSTIQATAIRQTHGQGIDNLEVFGLLTSAAIKDVDVLSGLYDNATIDLFVVNYLEIPTTNRALLLQGQIGEITIGTGYYQAEFRSLGQRLDQSVAELTSPYCRVRQLFDARCSPPGDSPATPTATPSTFRNTNTPVLSVTTDQKSITFGPLPGGMAQINYFQNGKITWTTGNNVPLAGEVKSNSASGFNATLNLQMVFPFTIQVGDQATLEAGCDRTYPTCLQKFNNVKNMRAEYFLPGVDKIIRWGRRR